MNRVALKFYVEDPPIWAGLLWFLLGPNQFRRFRLAREVSRILRATFENAGLTVVEEQARWTVRLERFVEKVRAYPFTEIFVDDSVMILRLRMLKGQTKKQWEAKVDAFAHAFSSELVSSRISRGVVELVLQHSPISADEVAYKEDGDPYLTLGMAPGGPLRWEFDRDPHMLVVGMTGRGKSTFVRHLLVQFRPEWILRIVDGKFVEFPFMRDLGYDVAFTEGEFMQFVDDAQAEVNRRFRLLQERKRNNYRDLGLQPYFLLVDEFIFLAESLSPTKKRGEDRSEREKMFGKLRDISLRGRAAGVFLILILQRPDSTFMPTVVRDNLMAKVVLGGSETAFEMAFGSEHRKLEPLGLGQGYAMIGERLTHFAFPNYEMADFVRDLELKVGRIGGESGRKEGAEVLRFPAGERRAN